VNQQKYFRLKLNEPKTFIKLFEILGKLLEFADLSISFNSLNLLAMDASHVLNVNLQLTNTFFNEYSVKLEKEIRVNLADFNRVLKRARGEAMFLMDCSYENKLLVQFQSTDSKRNFKVKTQDQVEPGEPIESLDYKASLSLVADYIAELVGDAALATDYATFALGPGDCFTIDTETTDGTEFNVEVKSFLEKPNTAGKQQAIYSLEYLSDITKLREVATKVSLKFSNEMPLQLVYPLEQESKIVLTLAPRVVDEDGEISDEPKKKRGKPLIIKDNKDDIDLEPEDESEKPDEDKEPEESEVEQG